MWAYLTIYKKSCLHDHTNKTPRTSFFSSSPPISERSSHGRDRMERAAITPWYHRKMAVSVHIISYILCRVTHTLPCITHASHSCLPLGLWSTNQPVRDDILWIIVQHQKTVQSIHLLYCLLGALQPTLEESFGIAIWSTLVNVLKNQPGH